MAGIGFKLEKYFKHDNLIDVLKGSFFSVIISSGPWLISVITIAVLSFFAQVNIDNESLFALKAVICYSFAISLILFGIIEMPITRYLADELYKNDYTTFKGLYVVLSGFCVLFGGSISAIFYSFFDEFTLLTKLTCVALFCATMIIWVSMIFLTAAKNYQHIVYSFVGGLIVASFLSYFMPKGLGMEGYLIAYTIGQLTIVSSLSACLFLEFRGVDYVSFDFLKYFKQYRILAFAGLFYYFGIWIDKFIFWGGPEGEQVAKLLYTNRYYDTAMFMAYITIVPSLAIFMVQIETNFYKLYTYYYQSIEDRNSLTVLDLNISDIFASIKKTIFNLIKIQLAITLTIWFFSEEILSFMYLPSLVAPIFKYGIVGAFLQALFLILNIIHLYFQNEKQVLINYGLFFLLNGVFTYISTFYDFRYYGLGYLLSTVIVFGLSLYTLNKFLNQLNFQTFMSQPIGNQ